MRTVSEGLRFKKSRTVDNAVSAVFGDLEQRFDFVMYCFPDNVDFGGAGTYPLPLLFPKALLKMLTHVVILLYLQLLGLL